MNNNLEKDLEETLKMISNLENNISDDDSVFSVYQNIQNKIDGLLTTVLSVNIKKIHDNAIIPSYAKDGDAGMDLTAVAMNIDNNKVEYSFGLAFEIPKGYVGLVYPRSSVKNYDLVLTNSVGVIDSGYRGEVKAIFTKINNGEKLYQIGDRVAQIMIVPYPSIRFNEVNELSETERGDSGFGSTGN